MKHLSSLALIALALAACAKKHNDPVTQPVVVPPPAIVGNTYVGDCIPTGHNESMRTTYAFSTDAKRVQHVDIFSDDANCTAASYSVDITSQYNTSGMISEGILALDYSLIGVTLTPQSEFLTRRWNGGSGYCRSNSWETGKPGQGTVACLDRELFNDIDREDQRIFTEVQIAGDDISLAQPNLDRVENGRSVEDGHSTDGRFTKIARDKFHKKGATPLQPTAPIEVGQCPAFEARYYCQVDGDDAFAGHYVEVSRNDTAIILTVKGRVHGEPDTTYGFVVDGQPHQTGNGRDFTETKTASCTNGQLDSTDLTVKTGQGAFTSKTLITLRSDVNRDLGIDVGMQTGNDPLRIGKHTTCNPK